MVMRGPSAMRAAMNTTAQRRGRNYDRAVQADSGEPFLFRFMGVISPIAVRYDKKQLQELPTEDITEHALLIGARIAEDMKPDELVDSILERYDQQEPVVSARHFIKRNQGQKGMEQYVNCGDAERVLTNNNADIQCRYCYAIEVLGDKGIGKPQAQYYFSGWDYRKIHQLRTGSGDKVEKSYEPCTAEGGICKHCSWNRSRKADDPQYRPVYSNGMRYFRLAGQYAEGVMACERRVRKLCRSCGVGKLKTVGACCPNPECGIDFDIDQLVLSGWDPENPHPITCGSCGETVLPAAMLECSRCDNPVPTQLHDVIVCCEKTGQDRSTSWSFNEQLPVQPLSFDDPDDAKILAAKLPDYESICATDPVDVQIRNIGGIREDPLAESLPSAPVIGGTASGRVVAGAPAAGVSTKKKAAAPPPPAVKKIAKGAGIFNRRA